MAFFNEFSNFFKFQPEKKSLELKNIFFETSSQKGMLGQNKKKFDFSSLIFDSRNILAASLKGNFKMTSTFLHGNETENL